MGLVITSPFLFDSRLPSLFDLLLELPNLMEYFAVNDQGLFYRVVYSIEWSTVVNGNQSYLERGPEGLDQAAMHQ